MKVPGVQEYFNLSKGDQKNSVHTFQAYMGSETDEVFVITLPCDLGRFNRSPGFLVCKEKPDRVN